MTNKIDTIAFAVLIARISIIDNRDMFPGVVKEIHGLVEDCIPPAPNTVSTSTINALLTALEKGERIPAVKAYRELTNCGLKEAMEAVRPYMEPTLGDILGVGVR